MVNKLPPEVNLSLWYFVDKFQGYYKHGLENTKDYRYLSVSHIVLMIVLCVVYACTLNRNYYITASFMVMLAAVMYSFIQPFKQAFSHYSKITTAFFVLLGLQYSLFVVWSRLLVNFNSCILYSVIFIYSISLNLRCGREWSVRNEGLV